MLDTPRPRCPVLLLGSVLLIPGCGSDTPTTPSPTPPPPVTQPPAPIETTTEFTSTDVPKDIPNGTRTTSVLDITGAATIVEVVSVSVSITHTWRGDLDVWLVHPDGTFVDLYRGDPFDSRDDVVDTYTPGTTPTLQRFASRQAEGRWRLLVDDTQFQDKGRLLSWSIRLRIRR